MKKIRFILVAFFSYIILRTFWSGRRPDQEQGGKEKELQMAEEIDAQKKAIAEQEESSV